MHSPPHHNERDRWRREKYPEPEKRSKRRRSCHFDRGCSTPWTPLIPLLLANCPWIAGPGRLFRTPGAPKASQCSGGTLKSVLPPLLQSNLVANWKWSPVEENQKTLCPCLAISIQAPVWQLSPERQTIELVTAAFACFATISAIY